MTTSQVLKEPGLTIGQPTSVRPLLILLAFAAGNAWFGAAVQSFSETGDPLYALFAASFTLLLYGVIGVPLLTLVLLPAMLLTMALVRRLGDASGRIRFAAGVGAWAGWGFVIWLATLAAPAEDRTVLVGAYAVGALGVLIIGGIQGGLFALVALGRPWRPPGRILIGLATAVVLFIIVGSLVTAVRSALAHG